MQTLIDKEYNVWYDYDYVGLSNNREDDLIYKEYKYFRVAKEEHILFEKYRKMRYDGCAMKSIVLFGYRISWGRFYDWIDREDERFLTLLVKKQAHETYTAFKALEKYYE